MAFFPPGTGVAANRFLWRTDRPLPATAGQLASGRSRLPMRGGGRAKRLRGGMIRPFLEHVAGLEFGSAHAVFVLPNECLVLFLP